MILEVLVYTRTQTVREYQLCSVSSTQFEREQYDQCISYVSLWSVVVSTDDQLSMAILWSVTIVGLSQWQQQSTYVYVVGRYWQLLSVSQHDIILVRRTRLDDIGLHSSDHRAGMFDDGSSGSIGQRRGSVLVCPSTRLLVLVPQVYVKIQSSWHTIFSEESSSLSSNGYMNIIQS